MNGSATGSHRGELAATLAAAIGQNGAAGLGGHAGTESVLPDAANLRGLILAFHDVTKLNPRRAGSGGH